MECRANSTSARRASLSRRSHFCRYPMETHVSKRTPPPTFRYEEKHWRQGRRCVVGVDEVGRGALAGPVVAAACLLDPRVEIEGLRDSKRLTQRQIRRISDVVMKKSMTYCVCVIDHDEIDRLNIRQATLKAMHGAVSNLQLRSGHDIDMVLIDGQDTPVDLTIDSETIVHGDDLSLSIAAASVVAKAMRDRIMESYDEEYPQYCFASNKGYGTERHRAAIKEHGPCPIHRKTFKM